MDRRGFLGTVIGGLFIVPCVVGAHSAGPRPRIGYLASGGRGRRLDTFLGRMRELGYQPGRTLDLEFRAPAEPGNADQLRELAAELVSLRVDVLVAAGPSAAAAAQHATRSTQTPVVVVGVDNPVGRGLVSSLARPGGNVTGATWDVDPETYATKTLKIMKQAISKSSRVAVLWQLDNPAAGEYVTAYQAIAPSLGLRLIAVGVSRPDELDGAFTQMVEQGADVVIVGAGHMRRPDRERIAELATSRRLPTLCGWRKWIVAGCLLSYGPFPEDMHRRAADYVDKILKGAKPADLPVERPTKFELVINLKTAKALGLTIPPSLLQRADQVIE